MFNEDELESPSPAFGLRRRHIASEDHAIRESDFEANYNSMPLGVALALNRPSSHVVDVLKVTTRGADLLELVRQLPQKVDAKLCSCFCAQDIETGTRSTCSTDSSSAEDLTSFGGSEESSTSPHTQSTSSPSKHQPPSSSSPPLHLTTSSPYPPSCHRCRNLLGRRLVLSLCEIHACILEVDEALIDSNLPSELLDSASSRLAVDSSRNWLERLQSFVMSLQRDVEAFMQHAVRSRMLTAAQHSAVQEVAWQALLHTMVEQVNHAMGPGSGVFPPSSPEAVETRFSRMTPEEAVASAVMSHFRAHGGMGGSIKDKEGGRVGGCAKRKGGSLLSYRVFWAGKVSI